MDESFELLNKFWTEDVYPDAISSCKPDILL